MSSVLKITPGHATSNSKCFVPLLCNLWEESRSLFFFSHGAYADCQRFDPFKYLWGYKALGVFFDRPTLAISRSALARSGLDDGRMGPKHYHV